MRKLEICLLAAFALAAFVLVAGLNTKPVSAAYAENTMTFIAVGENSNTSMYYTDDNYQDVLDADVATDISSHFYLGIGRQKSWEGNYSVFRSFVVFDTSSLPDGAVITSATITFPTISDSTATPMAVLFQSGMPVYPSVPQVLVDYDISKYPTNCGSVYVYGASAPVTGYLNDDGLAEINCNGLTKFALISSRDGLTDPPQYGVDEMMSFYGQVNYENLQPHLTVTYRSVTPCVIIGNENFIENNGVNGGGDGTEDHPWIIENLTISDNENAAGFLIENTTEYWIIRNCTFENLLYGIFKRNDVNGTIENCTFISDNYGVYMENSASNVVEHNTFEYCGYGIYSADSYYAMIHYNYLLYCINENYAYDNGANYWDYNWWSDWQPPAHPDVDLNGIIDALRPIAGGANEDDYPLALYFTGTTTTTTTTTSPAGPPINLGGWPAAVAVGLGISTEAAGIFLSVLLMLIVIIPLAYLGLPPIGIIGLIIVLVALTAALAWTPAWVAVVICVGFGLILAREAAGM